MCSSCYLDITKIVQGDLNLILFNKYLITNSS